MLEQGTEMEGVVHQDPQYAVHFSLMAISAYFELLR